MWKQRKGQVTMYNSTMIRTFHFSTFCIYMNPLMIQGSICKKINSVLRHFHIVGNSNLPS